MHFGWSLPHLTNCPWHALGRAKAAARVTHHGVCMAVLHPAGVQAGIGCVGASRMLAGDSSSVDAELNQPTWQQIVRHLPMVGGDGGDGGDPAGAGGDAKMALLGMGLILLSQVCRE